MPIRRKIGYDVVETYKEDELQRMYMNEGMPPSEAKIKARTLSLAMNKMAASERRFWERIRENEMCVGAEPKYSDDLKYKEEAEDGWARSQLERLELELDQTTENT